jgi:tRNA threonylcarbamoyladenosine biosynthesis protein TsaB
MRVLAIETSSPLLSVALGDSDRIIEESNMLMPRETMSEILPAIDDLLKRAGLAKDDIEVIIVGIGPGSYTGLRIGVVTAKSLAQTLGVPIIGIPSMDAIAYRNARKDVLVCPIVDAKRHEVYTAMYCMDAQRLKRLEEFKVISALELAGSLRIEEFDKVLLTGDGVGVYGEEMAKLVENYADFASDEMWWPRAADLISVAFCRIKDKQFDDIDRLSPIYVRKSQAEEMWEERHRGASE